MSVILVLVVTLCAVETCVRLLLPSLLPRSAIFNWVSKNYFINKFIIILSPNRCHLTRASQLLVDIPRNALLPYLVPF